MRQIPTERLVRQVEKGLFRLRPPQALLLSFIFLSLVGALLLKLPISSTQTTSWSQALFTAVSAATVTGLTVVDTGTHYTLFGQWVLIILMQLGGLGLMTFGLFVIYLARDRLTMQHSAVVCEALNEPGHGNLHGILKAMFGFTFVMEALGTGLLALKWVPEMGLGRGLYYSFFHAVSAFNNAGFGLQPDNLVSYAGSSLVNAVISVLFIAGGIGFAVIADLVNKRRFRDFALHTKVMLVGTLTVNLLAMLVILVLEYGNPGTLGKLPDLGSKLWAAWFQGVAPRTAGFNSVDIGALVPASAFFIMGLMFIGAGSGSTASGIKLSTFIVLLASTRAFLRADERPVIFGRSLHSSIIIKSMSITIMSLFCVVSAIFVLSIFERHAFLDLAFEAFSAFGTVGLTRGITPSLSLPGQAVIMILMLIGRIGPLTLAFTLANRQRALIEYPAGKLTVG
jgi:trk system potassium uptake protein